VGLSDRVFRPAIVKVAHHTWVRRFATRSRIGRSVATRFVAGETLADALAVARDLADDGLTAMLNHLGENVHTMRDALSAREAYLAEVASVADNEGLDLVISTKLTQLGLEDSVDACWSNVEPILDAAAVADLDVMIDMEEHETVDATLEVYRRAHAHYPRAGLCLQSYLRRTPDDLFGLPAGCRVRLVKGAYLEPRDVVLRDKDEVDRAFRRLFTTALERGHPVDVATHDPEIIDGVKRRVADVPGGWERVEFQMLYGVRRDLQRELAREGYPVRVYIPYGTEWYPYLTRRMAERPANLWFFLSNLTRTAR
jgi:proline dehydrogenase